MHRLGSIILVIFAMRAGAASMAGRGLLRAPGTFKLAAGPAAASRPNSSASIDRTGTAPIFGGYANASFSLTAVAADGEGSYAVVGISGDQAYLAVYNSFDHLRICESAFVPVDPSDPFHVYDHGHAFGVAFGRGVVYVAGEAHDASSTPDDFDAFLQAFDPASCEKLDPVVIDGDVRHDAFNAVAVTAAGVIAAGYTGREDEEVFLAERWSPDLTTSIYQHFYPVEGTTGGNHTNAVAFDELGNAWVFGFVHFTPAPSDQRLELHGLNPDGSIRNGTLFVQSDSGPSQYTSARLGPDGLIYSGGTIVDSRLPGGPGPFALFEAGYSTDLSSLRCSLVVENAIGSSGMDLDNTSPIPQLYAVVNLDPAGAPPRPSSLIRVNGNDCTLTEAGPSFGSLDGIDVPGGLSFDHSTNSARNVAGTSGTDYTPNTDGSALVPPENGFQTEFGNFCSR
jgi:hypothetical protein